MEANDALHDEPIGFRRGLASVQPLLIVYRQAPESRPGTVLSREWLERGVTSAISARIKRDQIPALACRQCLRHFAAAIKTTLTMGVKLATNE